MSTFHSDYTASYVVICVLCFVCVIAFCMPCALLLVDTFVECWYSGQQPAYANPCVCTFVTHSIFADLASINCTPHETRIIITLSSSFNRRPCIQRNLIIYLLLHRVASSHVYFNWNLTIVHIVTGRHMQRLWLCVLESACVFGLCLSKVGVRAEHIHVVYSLLFKSYTCKTSANGQIAFTAQPPHISSHNKHASEYGIICFMSYVVQSPPNCACYASRQVRVGVLPLLPLLQLASLCTCLIHTLSNAEQPDVCSLFIRKATQRTYNNIKHGIG